MDMGAFKKCVLVLFNDWNKAGLLLYHFKGLHRVSVAAAGNHIGAFAEPRGIPLYAVGSGFHLCIYQHF